MNSAIIKAIQITEEKDFTKKNAEALSVALGALIDVFAEYKKTFSEIAQNVVSNIIIPVKDAFTKIVKEGTWIKSLGNFAINSCLAEESKAIQELEDSIKPLTSIKDNLIPPWVEETQNTINSIKIDTPFTEFSSNDILNADSSSQNDDIEVSDTLDENSETDS